MTTNIISPKVVATRATKVMSNGIEISTWRPVPPAGSWPKKLMAKPASSAACVPTIDRSLRCFPLVNPTLFVDDLSAEIVSTQKLAVEQLGGYVEMVAGFIAATGQKLSDTKSVFKCKSLNP